MVSCARANVWTQQPENKWSTAAIGIDQRGRLLFIHVRSPLSTHDLIDALLALPLELREAMYVEGGPEAQLYVHAGGRELEFVGSHGSSFAGIENTMALPIPNVLGIRRVAQP
jgi:Phosphodiester glycosidase